MNNLATEDTESTEDDTEDDTEAKYSVLSVCSVAE